jgi:hypothetical protein
VSRLALSHTIVAVDIVSSSSGERHRQHNLDQHLAEAIDHIFEFLAGSPYAPHTGFRRIDGDSVTMALPAAIPRAWIAADLVLRELTIALGDLNRSVVDGDRLRLRVAIDHGELVVGPRPHLAGDAVARAARLLDGEPLRLAMRQRPEAPLGLIVSDRFFHEVIVNRERDLDPDEFTRVTVSVKDFEEAGWIRLTRSNRGSVPVLRTERVAEVINRIDNLVNGRVSGFGAPDEWK